MKFLSTTALCLALAFALPCPGSADIAGTVITAKTGKHALLIWDSTAAIEQMEQDKQSQSDALLKLESQAMTIAGERANVLSGYDTISVRVVYSKVGAVNPAYGTPTFAGIETVFNLTVSARSAKNESASLAQSLAKGAVPKEVTLTITGKLPPM